MENKPTIFYLHIPKTGGSTLQGIINRNYKKNQIVNLFNQKQADEFVQAHTGNVFPRVVKGHFSFGAHTACAHLPFSYITVIRNPVDRLISIYYYLLTREKHPVAQIIREKKLTLAQFVEQRINNLVENGQTKMIAGVKNYDHTICTQEIYNQAIYNIDNFFGIVGLTERFDESVLLMAHTYNWKWKQYMKANITSSRPAVSAVDTETMKVLTHHSAWDVKLYAYCNDRLNKQWMENPNIQAQLSAYSKRNKFLSKLSPLRKLWPGR